MNAFPLSSEHIGDIEHATVHEVHKMQMERSI